VFLRINHIRHAFGVNVPGCIEVYSSETFVACDWERLRASFCLPGRQWHLKVVVP
jgi:hypothetical protein